MLSLHLPDDAILTAKRGRIMKLLMVGGFLGAGKTTLIKELIELIEGDGQRIAIIENEYGKENIDSEILTKYSINVVPLSGGCVCCQIAGSLIGAMAEIEDEISPDWLIIELSGMAITQNAIVSLRNFYRPDLSIHAVTVIDASRYDVLMKVAGPSIISQLNGAEAVYLSKVNAGDPDINTTLPIYKDPRSLWKQLNSGNPSNDISISIADDSTPGKVITTEESFDGVVTTDEIKEYIRQRFHTLGNEYQIEGMIPGHIKAIAKYDGGFIAGSMTNLYKITFEESKNHSEPIDHYDLIINVLLFE